MYKKINVHPGTRQVYADKLALQGVVSPEEAKEMVAAYRRSLESGIPPRQTALIEARILTPLIGPATTEAGQTMSRPLFLWTN